MSKFCTNCGAQLADNAAFCTSCGTPVANIAAPVQAAPAQAAPAQNYAPTQAAPAQNYAPAQAAPAQNYAPAQAAPAQAAPEKKKSKAKVFIIVGVVAVLAAIIAVLAVFVLPSLGKDDSSEKDEKKVEDVDKDRDDDDGDIAVIDVEPYTEEQEVTVAEDTTAKVETTAPATAATTQNGGYAVVTDEERTALETLSLKFVKSLETADAKAMYDTLIYKKFISADETEDVIEDLASEINSALDSYKEDLGDNLRFTFDTYTIKVPTETEKNEFLAEFFTEAVDFSSIKDLKAIQLQLKVSGSNGEETDDDALIVAVLSDGAWQVIYCELDEFNLVF